MDFTLTVQQQKIQQQVRSFARERVAPFSREMDERGSMPMSLIKDLASIGFLGGPLPIAFGGSAWDSISLALCYEELGRVDSSVRGLMTVHTSLVSQCIVQWGNDLQKQNYLPKLARGELIGCYCLTEPNAGCIRSSIRQRSMAMRTSSTAKKFGSRMAALPTWQLCLRMPSLP